jgi:hypothetical protein
MTTTPVKLRFSGGIGEWEPGEKVQEGFIRTHRLGTGLDQTVIGLLANFDRITNAIFDDKELVGTGSETRNKWALINQENSIPWAPDALFITGVKINQSGFLGEYKITGKSRKVLDYVEMINFGFVATAATGIGMVIYQPNHGFNRGEWLTCTDNGYVLAQPDDAALRETDGVISAVIGTDAFVLECAGFGCDANLHDIDDFWDYDPGITLYLAQDGTVTDTKPPGIARQLAKIVDFGIARIDMKTLLPTNYQPDFDVWPSDSLLKLPLDNGGFRIFYYVGAEPGRQIGTYMNPNCGKAAISPPVRL